MSRESPLPPHPSPHRAPPHPTPPRPIVRRYESFNEAYPDRIGRTKFIEMRPWFIKKAYRDSYLRTMGRGGVPPQPTGWGEERAGAVGRVVARRVLVKNR